jgi:cyclopropane fatty-acyl-phospholipid synthase-like methyltransferase
MDDETKLFYDLTAQKTADEWYDNNILKPTIQHFIRLLPGKPRVLDLGCGPGHESMRLALAGADVVGIDFSQECIRIAQERCTLPQCQFEVMDFRRLDERWGTFDGVFACASLIHIDPETLPDVISRIRKILHNNGHLMAIIIDGEGILESKSNLEYNKRKLRRTVYGYTKEHMSTAAEKCDFTFVSNGYLDKDLLKYGWRTYIFKALRK